jgi:medium-chain acyl-[acyl-carrier-protein] hydrolase
MLFVSGRRAPHIPDTDPPLHRMSDGDLLTNLEKMNGMPPEVLQNPELVELILPMRRADCALTETFDYVKWPPLPIPITAFGGSDDEETQENVWMDGAYTRRPPLLSMY